MELIKQNKEKHRSVFFNGTCYKKVWSNTTPNWISDHVQLLENVVPGYVIDHGRDWITFNIIPGTPANTVPHTDEFIKRIHKFCLDNIQSTAPYVHGDWVLSNMLIDGDTIRMCDWDNLGFYPQTAVLEKLDKDLASAFGDRYWTVIYDTASI